MRVGIMGLGRMGGNIARRLLQGGHEIVGFDRNSVAVAALSAEGVAITESLDELAARLEEPRIFWVMLPAGPATESTIEALISLAAPGDIIIDGGNSFYKDDIRRAKVCAMKNLHYVDVGTSGGVWAATRLLHDDRRRQAGDRTPRSDLRHARARLWRVDSHQRPRWPQRPGRARLYPCRTSRRGPLRQNGP